MKYQFLEITNPSELERLKDKTAADNRLTFSFSADYIQKLKDHLVDKNAYQLFALDETQNMAGYIASAEGLFPNHQWIIELFIDPQYQNQGIGTQLVQKVIGFAKQHHMAGVITETEFENIPAQGLYEKCGLTKINNPHWKKGVTYHLPIVTDTSRKFDFITSKLFWAPFLLVIIGIPLFALTNIFAVDYSEAARLIFFLPIWMLISGYNYFVKSFFPSEFFLYTASAIGWLIIAGGLYTVCRKWKKYPVTGAILITFLALSAISLMHEIIKLDWVDKP